MNADAIRISTVAPADLPRWAELHRKILPQALSDVETSLGVEAIERGLAAIPKQERFLAELDGELVGLARTASHAHALALGGVYGFIAVDEAFRRQGVGTRLYAAVSAWAESASAQALVTKLTEAADEGLSWARRRGFVEIARAASLTLDLERAPVPAIVVPDGVELTTLADRPDLLRGIYEVELEAMPDEPGLDRIELPPFDQWQRVLTELRDTFKVFVATTPTEVVAAANLGLRPGGLATHNGTTVKRAWRRRGLARALKATQISWAKEAGYIRLETTNDTRNIAMLSLNESFGFTALPAMLTLRGPLAQTD